MAESRGQSIIRSGDGSILFRVTLFDATNAKIISGTTDLRIWHVIPTTGALETFDFDDNTFKAGAITTATANPTHRTAENSTYDTGFWTFRQTALGGFTKGDKYVAEFDHAILNRPIQVEFQYGDVEGDQVIDIPDAIWDEARAGHVSSGSFGETIAFLHVLTRAELKTTVVETAQSGTNEGDGTGTIVLDAGQSATNNIFRGDKIVIVGGTGAGQSRLIIGYVGSSKTASTRPEWEIIPDITSQYVIVSGDAIGQAEEIWSTDITALAIPNSAAVILTALNLTTRTVGFNTLNGLLGVPDTAGLTLVDQIWDEARAGHNSAGSIGEVINNLSTLSVSTISDAVWDEDIVAAHGTAGTAGLLIRVLGAAISTRANNATLNALLGVPDTSGINIADTIWDENIVSAHGTASTSGFLLRVLGAAISTRANNATLNALLGVVDTASATIAWTIADEVVSASAHNTSNSIGQRLTAIDVLTEASGTGDLAAIKTSTDKMDATALSGTPTSGSVAHKLNSIITTLSLADRELLIAVNIEGTTLHIEVAVQQYGIVQTSPWTRCQAQIFNEAGSIIVGGNISIGQFGSINPRGFFTVDVNPHGIVAGQTYEMTVIVDDAGANVITTSKSLAVLG